jgi:hypothetical protein
MYFIQTTEIIKKSGRRIFPDRREVPTPFISRYTFIGGRRRAVRRKEDMKKDYFVDLYSTRLLVTVISLLILSIFDGCLTLILIKENIAFEANPIMASYLNFGDMSFLVGKFIITTVSVIILCICKNFPFTRALLVSALIIYIGIVAYELIIMFKFIPDFTLYASLKIK